MKTSIAFLLRLFVFAIISTSIISCKNEPNQMPIPSTFTPLVKENTVNLTWTGIPNAIYIIELSRDSLEFKTDFKTDTIIGATSLIVENLWSNSRYSARIKVVSKDAGIKDSEYKTITFLTQTENIFYSISPESITSNTVMLSWNPLKKVSKIIVSLQTQGSVHQIVLQLSAEEILNGKKLVEGLISNTNFVFKIFLDEMVRGEITVKTKST